jgi:uncharacterized protein
MELHPSIVPECLRAFFEENPRVLLAFSGGTDSSYLLFAAVASGADVVACTAKGPFQPDFETEDALSFAKALGVRHSIVLVDPLSHSGISANGPDRCYLCKRMLFGRLCEIADNEERCLIDATNASDDPSSRPGMRALDELGVVSPLRICGIAKADVRRLSRESDLPFADKPSNSCLATRISTGTAITAEALERVERSEDEIRGLGFSGFRVRDRGDQCILEIQDHDKVALDNNISEVESILNKYYSGISYGRRPSE